MDIDTKQEIDSLSISETYLVSESSFVQSSTVPSSSQSQVSQALLQSNIPINLPE